MSDNTTTKNYADGTPLFESDLDDLYQDLQLSKANAALLTTGSSSGQLLQSAGSNTEPSWVSADTVGASMTATGANAVFADITSGGTTGAAAYVLAAVSACTGTVANIIGNAMLASGANAVVASLSSVSPSAANLIGAALSSMAASVAVMIASAVTRSVASSVGLMGVAISPSSGAFGCTTTAFTDVTNLSVSITTSGRPIKIECISTETDSSLASYVTSVQATSISLTGFFARALQGTTTVGTILLSSDPVNFDAPVIKFPPNAISFIDTGAVAGTYTYKIQVAGQSAGDQITINRIKLAVYEL